MATFKITLRLSSCGGSRFSGKPDFEQNNEPSKRGLQYVSNINIADHPNFLPGGEFPSIEKINGGGWKEREREER